MKTIFNYRLGRSYTAKIRRTGFLFIVPMLLYFVLVFLVPLISSIYLSFLKWQPGGTNIFVGFSRYTTLFRDPLFWQCTKNTFYFVGCSVPIIITLGFAIALFLNWIQNQKTRIIYAAIYFLPGLCSLIAAALIWEWIFHPIFGLLNNVLGLVRIPPHDWLESYTEVIPSLAIINIWLRLGLAVLIFLSGLQAIASEYYESSQIDGANLFQRFWYITLPLMNPIIVLVFIIETSFAFKVFDQVYTTTGGGPANASRVVILYLYENAFKWMKMGYASAIGVIVFSLLLIISILEWKVRKVSQY